MPATNTVSADPLARIAEQQDWIRTEVEETAQGVVQSSFQLLGNQGDRVRAFLQGEWLHQPLHAVLTDVPVGAWTATVAFDSAAALTGRAELDAASDGTLWLGLLGAAAAAIAGLTDWSEIDKPEPRRIGSVHALLNIGATALFGASCIARLRGNGRASARALAAAGYCVLLASAHLGGNLVYEHGIGVRSTNAEQQTGDQQDPESAPAAF